MLDVSSETARGDTSGISNTEHSTLNDEVLNTFRGEIGVVEGPEDNTGERVEEYLEACGLGPGYAWCACFCVWGMDKNGVVNPGSAWTPDWFPDSAVVYERGAHGAWRNVEPVDVIGIWFQSKGRIAHVGVIDTVTSSYVITIEGNTNDSGGREGDRVMRKRRLKRQIYKVSEWVKN